VSQLLKRFTLAALALLLAVAPSVPLAAQQVKPVVVVSLAPIEKTRADVMYLAELVGQKDAAEGALNLAPIFLNGIDMKRPLGAYLLPAEGGEFKFVVFVPVTKLDTVLKTFEEQIGKPTDLGDGLKQLDPPTGEPVFLKEVKGWAFASNDKDSLADLPADPAALLGNLPTVYNVAVRANVHDVPAELRQTAVDAIQSGLDRGLENAPDDADRELAEKMSRMSAKQFTRLIEEIDELTIGWGVDKTIKATYIDFQITAVDGTSMARQMALIKDGPTAFTGFLMPGSSLNAAGSSPLSKEDIDQNVALLEVFRAKADKEIDNDAGLDANQRVTAKELIGQFFSVLTDTLKGGKIDFGATLMLEEKKLGFAGGIVVADGKKLETAFAKLVDLGKNEPDFPDVKLNAGKHGNVNLHTINADIPADEDEARQIFGEKLNVVIGTAPKALYVAFGPEGEALLKKAIDQSAARAAEKVAPSQMNIFLKPILKFAASMDDSGNPILQQVVEAADAVEAGSDEVNFVSKPIPNGTVGRMQVNEGVLKLIGAAVEAAQSMR
jgi:hypothetical protein